MTSKAFEQVGSRLVARHRGETVWVEACGPSAVRVRATRNAAIDPDRSGALLATEPAADGQVTLSENAASLIVGSLRAEVRLAPRGMGPALELAFFRADSGTVLLEEEPPHILWPGSRHFEAEGGDLWSIKARFKAQEGERFYGMGQHQHGRFDLKGCVLDLHQKNTEISIPFLLSSRGYGLLWNNPGIGRVELANNRTVWALDASKQLDYVVFAGDGPADLLEAYTEVTGRPPLLPDWVLGYWQCKLRYKTQDEVLAVAETHLERGHPMACMVVDFFHWTKMGEWTFRSDEFPDPSGMVATLKAQGIEPMVSVWPSVNANAETYETFTRQGWLVASRRGAMDGSIFYDREPDGMNPLRFYDATHPEARAFHWDRVKQGYVDHGFHAFWLDANEPEMYPMHPDNLRFHLGDGRDVANIYPFLHQLGYAEGFAEAGIADGVLLSRSAWAGSQRFPLVLWSGDVQSTFSDLRRQLTAGLNMAASGISWWTTDIGGFKGGDVNDPAFHELLVRWFQWGALCPVFRLHGFRQDASRDARFGKLFSFGGADNEVWSFGQEVEDVLGAYMALRERLRPYLKRLMDEAHTRGLPPMRPLFMDFPEDPASWDVHDAYMFGGDLLVAPVLDAGASERQVYLPPGATWTCAWTGEVFAGGGSMSAATPLARIPVYIRDGAAFSGVFVS
ncbi:MAG: hypothetical protein KI785_06375 [Devosiaceae bacterium]|nr:hypothetical protein [Devosiaceae bacterium MH13]